MTLTDAGWPDIRSASYEAGFAETACLRILINMNLTENRELSRL